jgi:hypothetical protein
MQLAEYGAFVASMPRIPLSLHTGYFILVNLELSVMIFV